MKKSLEPDCGFENVRHPISKTGSRLSRDMLLAALTIGGRVCVKWVFVPCTFIAVWIWLSAPSFAKDLTKKYEFNIREETLGSALDVIVRQTGFLVLFPYELAGKTGIKPLKGQYTVSEALDVLLRDTGLSGGLRESGIIEISLAKTKDPNREDKMKQDNLKRSLLASVAVFLFGAGGAQGQATTSDDGSSRAVSFEEVIVTANRQSAVSAQDVAMAVSAINPADMNAKGLGGLQDFSRTIPSLNVTEQSPGVNRIDIRGLTTGMSAASNIQDRPLAAVYLDDIPMSLQGYSPDIRVFDLERIEVIRGPQGTLYGAGSMAGTIRYITAKPTTDGVSGSVEGLLSTTKHGGENYSLRGIANLPLSDTLAIRVSGYQGKNEGYIDNIEMNRPNANSDESTQARVALRWMPSDIITLDASITFAKLDVNGSNATLQHVGKYKNTTLVPEGFDDNLKIYNLTGELDLDFATLTSATSYLDRSFAQQLTYEHSGPLFGLPRHVALGVLDNSLKDFSEEIRLVSAPGGIFNWSMGGFYQKGKRDYYQLVDAPGFDAAFGNLIGNPNFNSQTDYMAFGPDVIFSGTQNIDERQYALFGEGSVTLGKFEFTAGVRYFNWRQEFDLYFSGIAGALGPGRPLAVTGKAKANGFNPRFVVSYKPTDDMMIYAEAAKGFRYGGVNQPVAVTICAADLAAIGRTEGPTSFGPDNLWSYAVGTKNEFMDRRITFNLSAFYIEWKNVQTTKNLSCGYRFTENAGQVKSTGLELETRFHLTDEFTLAANASYTKAEADGDLVNIGALDGDRVPFFPKYMVSLAADYIVPLGSADLKFSADFQARGASYTEFRETNPMRRKIPSSEFVNLSVTYMTDAWEFGVFANNLTNNAAVSQITSPSGLQPTDVHFLGRPRTLGARVKYSF